MKTCYQLLFIVFSAAFLGCEAIINEEDLSGETVILTAPSDTSEFVETDIVLSWETLEGADQYHIQIATPSFETALQVVRDSIVSENHFSVSLDSDKYAWRVKALNSVSETKFSARTFTINE